MNDDVTTANAGIISHVVTTASLRPSVAAEAGPGKEINKLSLTVPAPIITTSYWRYFTG